MERQQGLHEGGLVGHGKDLDFAFSVMKSHWRGLRRVTE